ncbi:MAG: radical SAM protein [Desulfohalobiaceae bacterium]
MDWLRKLFPFRPRFHAWQIEVTSRCGLRCPSCFHNRKDTERQDLPWEHLQRLKPHLDRVDNVILQGWGEPLLYPYFPEALELVASRGPSSGFVTSGYGLNELWRERWSVPGPVSSPFSWAVCARPRTLRCGRDRAWNGSGTALPSCSAQLGVGGRGDRSFS